MAANKLDRNPNTQERCRINWQRLHEGAATGTIGVDGVTIENTGSALRVKDLGISTAKLATNAVTFPKMQNVVGPVLLGRSATSNGNIGTLTLNTDLAFSGSALQIAAFTGDVTKTAGGTALTLATVNANIGTFNNVTVNAKGLVTAASNVAYLTGNQTMTLSGDVTGSGTTAITTTITNGTVTTAKLADGAVTLAKLGVLTTKGDLLGFDGSNHTRVAVGTGQLIRNASATSGFQWGHVVDTAGNTFASRQTFSNTNALTNITSTTAQASATVTNLATTGSPGNNLGILRTSGIYSSANAGDTLTISLNVRNLTTTVTVASIVLTMAGTETNVPITVDAACGWTATGASGTADGWLRLTYGATSTTMTAVPTSAAVIDTTTATNSFTIAIQWSTARVSNSFTVNTRQSLWFSNGIAF